MRDQEVHRSQFGLKNLSQCEGGSKEKDRKSRQPGRQEEFSDVDSKMKIHRLTGKSQTEAAEEPQVNRNEAGKRCK